MLLIAFNRMVELEIYAGVEYMNIVLTRHWLGGICLRKHESCMVQCLGEELVIVPLYMSCCVLVCLKEGKPEVAEEYFQKGKARGRGIAADAALDDVAIGAVCKSPDSRLALVLLGEMREMGWVPSRRTYTSVKLESLQLLSLSPALLMGCAKAIK
ncbi:hypothetical protein RchiOBHm_Chr7g0216401 [Rosa chinensis]|uniref:Pentatricopeptide n=1 Tax=Rosa chinensis TaxID=74649 RepID=A0A2P6PBQ7_ROSCH|nr:hypothetical protein RchiOBHm_Chr7g0216401 [Rosa chinensis]